MAKAAAQLHRLHDAAAMMRAHPDYAAPEARVEAIADLLHSGRFHSWNKSKNRDFPIERTEVTALRPWSLSAARRLKTRAASGIPYMFEELSRASRDFGIKRLLGNHFPQHLLNGTDFSSPRQFGLSCHKKGICRLPFAAKV